MSHGHCGPALCRIDPGMMPGGLAALKSTIRSETLTRRATVDAEARSSFSLRLAAIGPGLVHRHTAASRPLEGGSRPIVSAFLPIRGEPDCRPLLEALAAIDLPTALPVTPARGRPLSFHLWRSGEPLAVGRWRIPEPRAESPAVDPDVLFVPLAAFDRRGHRLGYGAGFYDNALAVLRARKPVLAVGVAFGLQEVEAVPHEPHDERLDMIVTEHAVFIAATP